MLESCLPNTLKRLTLYEDGKSAYPGRFDLRSELLRDPTANASVAKVLAKTSLRLEQFCASSFLIDVNDFFQAYQPGWIWKDLVSLALTSRLVNSTEHLPKYINNMLYAAGVAARNMPKLQTMKIWQGRMGHVCDCVFRYQVTDGLPKIISLWHFPLESRVVETWEAVALECTGKALCIRLLNELKRD